MDNTKITLKNVEIVFANLVDEGFGKSLTVNATDKDVRESITKWVVDNKIGKKEPGVANFKDYEGKKQYAFKINDYTQFAGLNGLTKENLGFGATVHLTAKAFDYDNKFGKGTSGALEAVVVTARAKTGADEAMSELMGDLGADDKLPLAPVNDAPPPTDDDAPIDLSSIPFN